MLSNHLHILTAAHISSNYRLLSSPMTAGVQCILCRCFVRQEGVGTLLPEDGATGGPNVVTHSPGTLLGYTAGERRHTKGWPNRFVKFCKKKEKSTKWIGRQSLPVVDWERNILAVGIRVTSQQLIGRETSQHLCSLLLEGDFPWKQHQSQR